MERAADDAADARRAPPTDAIWAPAMSRVQAALQQERASTSTEDVLEAVRVALADATGAYAAALADGARERYGSVFNLLDHASRLLTAVASVDRPEGRDDAVRNWLADQLASQLRSHEAAVLEGELTYALDASDIEGSLQRATNGLQALSAPTGGGFGDRLAVRVAAAEIAALLVRAAANEEPPDGPRMGR